MRHEADHRGSRPADDLQAALLIDFDNVTMGIRSNLGQELRNLLNSDVIRGKVAVQRAYADWRRYPQYIVPLSEASIDLIFAPAYGSSKKNATDIRLAIDALELVFIRPEIRTYILMSGDSDFSSLVLKLKEYGKYIIGVGIQESSSDLLVQNCDEYYSYSALSGLSKAGDQPLERHDPWELVQKAVDKMVERGDTMRSDRLKQVMLEIDPSFNEKELGFNKFNRFVVEAKSRGLVSIQKMENGQYGIIPRRAASQAAKKEEAPAEEVKPQGRRGGERRERDKPRARRGERRKEEEGGTSRARPKLTMQSALELLNQALEPLLEVDDSIRDSDVKRKLLELDPSFDEGELGYSKFSKFLHAAEEAGAVELTRGPNSNIHVRRRSKGKKRATSAKARPESTVEDPREPTMKRLARFFFGERPPEAEFAPHVVEERQPATTAEAKEREPRREERPTRREAPRSQPREPRRERQPGSSRTRPSDSEPSARGRREGRPGAQPEKGEAASSRGRRRGRGGRPTTSDRRREERSHAAEAGTHRGAREERGASERAPAAEPAAPVEARPRRESEESVTPVTPVSAERKAEPTVAQPAKAEAGEQRPTQVEPAPLPGAPRGTIRGRWGSRGRYRPAAAPPPIYEGQRSPRSGTAADDTPGGQPAPVDKGDRREPGDERAESLKVGGPAEATTEMAGGRAAGATAPTENALVSRLRSYAGVGDRTAQTLVEAFGADLFRVMDEQPDRIREVLPDHRADRVLEARRKELESSGR